MNPADLATRGVRSRKLMETSWLVGPEFLRKPERTLPTNETFALIIIIIIITTLEQRGSRNFLH